MVAITERHLGVKGVKGVLHSWADVIRTRRLISIPVIFLCTAVATALGGPTPAEAATHTVSALTAAPAALTVGQSTQLTVTISPSLIILLDQPVPVSFGITQDSPNAGTTIPQCTVTPGTLGGGSTCRTSYVGTLSGKDTIIARVDAADPGKTTSVTWQGIPAAIFMSPLISFNTAGGPPAAVTATVVDRQGKPVVGSAVGFSVTGPGATSGAATTDASGNAGFSFASSSTGKSTVVASTPGAGSSVVTASATADWAGPPNQVALNIGGATSGIAPVNGTASVVAAVTDSGGIPVGDNTNVDFTVSGVGNTQGTAATSGGNASFSFGAAVTGTSVVTASAGSPPILSNSVTVTWQTPVATTVSLAPKQTRAIVGNTQVLVATITDQFGRPFSGALVRFALLGVNAASTTSSYMTGADGKAAFLDRGVNVGIDTLVAFVDLQNTDNLDPGDPVDTANIFWLPQPGQGYWLAASDGGIFNYGPATSFEGSTGGIHLNQPIVGMARTPSGFGYWLVASDGGIFAFGDATFRGSTGSIHLNKPIVGMTATPDGGGYLMVASDGGIFAFGNATFQGSTGSIHLNQPIVGMASTPTGGYWLAASDGGIFNFGPGASLYGSLGSVHLNKPIVGIGSISDGSGYFMAASDGGVFNFGPGATLFGSAAGAPLNKPVVAIAVAP